VNSGPDFEDDERTAVLSAADLRQPRGRKQMYHLLVQVQGTEMGRVRVLKGDNLMLGRSSDADIWISDDGVSRKHARLSLRGPTYTVEDLGSANGTYVQGVRLDGSIVLHDGDQIQVGPAAILRYTVTDEDQKQLLEQLYSTSVTDALTGARNREHMDSILVSEISYAKRHQSNLAFLLFDLDHFKRINDTLGHPAGDAVLVAVAGAIRGEVRREDSFCRYGGEEFALILRDIGPDGAMVMAERVRSIIEALDVPFEGKTIKVTASVGAATLKELTDAAPLDLVKLADQRLYKAKQGGRNRVVGGA
jgi:two-component system, cell cycle response regulator